MTCFGRLFFMVFGGETIEISRGGKLWEVWRFPLLLKEESLLKAKQILLEWRILGKITLISFLFIYCASSFPTNSWSYSYVGCGYWRPHIGLLVFLFMIYTCSSSNLLLIHHDWLWFGLILDLCYYTVDFESLFDLILVSFECFYLFLSPLMIYEIRFC